MSICQLALQEKDIPAANYCSLSPQSNILLHIRAPRLIVEPSAIVRKGRGGCCESDNRRDALAVLWLAGDCVFFLFFFMARGGWLAGDRVQSHRTFIALEKKLIYCKLFTELCHYLWTRRINTGTHSHS